jgi:hypothetical protein
MEELIAKTDIRLVVIDPNGDFGPVVTSLGGLEIRRRLSRITADKMYVASTSDPAAYEAALEASLKGARAIVLDLNRLDTALWTGVVGQTLRGLWDRRDERRPTCLFIDEVHNFAPAQDAMGLDSPLTAILRIAAEGRKYGLWLVIASQRPQKVHSNLISQCDNLVLMKLTNQRDIEHVAESFSTVSIEMVQLARGFKRGWALAVGRIVRSPTLLRFRERATPEGGGDLSLAWACGLKASPSK